ncbi:MAG: inositol monophosphatase [Actinomycetaceae bacterium]|nr:inositol monophosphatase [Actinomycetaceae bacterium]
MSELDELLQIAKMVVTDAGKIALNPGFALDIDTKTSRNDLVTQVDKRIEAQIAAQLEKVTRMPLLGEENHQVDSFNGRVWVLDPIDGTMNYVTTKRDYAISLALCEDGIPVLGVVLDVTKGALYSAITGQGAFRDGTPLTQVDAKASFTDTILITDLKEILALPRLANALVRSRGHRRYGSAALEMIEVALGQAGAFIHLWVSPWDIAAASLICAEAGVICTRLDGTYLDVCAKGSVLAAWPKVHQELHYLLIQKAFDVD